MSETNSAERRVYHLTPDMLDRIRAYQAENKIPSEVEAVRRLLTQALEARDTVETILVQLQKRFAEEGDLRILASEILARHSLVTEVRFGDEILWFRMRSGRKGQINSRGAMFIGEQDSQDDWLSGWTPDPPVRHRSRSATSKGGWDAPKSDLDDDVPF